MRGLEKSILHGKRGLESQFTRDSTSVDAVIAQIGLTIRDLNPRVRVMFARNRDQVMLLTILTDNVEHFAAQFFPGQGQAMLECASRIPDMQERTPGVRSEDIDRLLRGGRTR